MGPLEMIINGPIGFEIGNWSYTLPETSIADIEKTPGSLEIPNLETIGF